jgi:hypothetical protein
VDPGPLLAQRLTAQRLAGPPAENPLAATRHLLAVQAQDARGARLAIRARTPPDQTVAHFDRALTAERTLLVSWLCRGTLHLVAREDYHWLHALTTPPLRIGNARRLHQEGVSPGAADRAVAAIERSLAEEGPLSRIALRERIEQAGIPVPGQALVHVLFRATLDGVAVRGPVAGAQHLYALAPDWLGPPPAPLERDRALAELARRYLIGHAPAGERDLARWAGLPLRDARAGLGAIATYLVHRPDGLLALRAAAPPAPLPPPRLLGPWDPVTVGWGDRSFVTGEHDARMISGGLFRPFALVNGRAAAVWRLSAGRVEIDPPFIPVSGEARAELEADAAAVERYFAGSERA